MFRRDGPGCPLGCSGLRRPSRPYRGGRLRVRVDGQSSQTACRLLQKMKVSIGRAGNKTYGREFQEKEEKKAKLIKRRTGRLVLLFPKENRRKLQKLIQKKERGVSRDLKGNKRVT